MLAEGMIFIMNLFKQRSEIPGLFKTLIEVLIFKKETNILASCPKTAFFQEKRKKLLLFVELQECCIRNSTSVNSD